MKVAPRLRPMGVLQILGAALRLYRQHVTLFATLAAAGVVPLAVLVLGLHHGAVVRGLVEEGRTTRLWPWYLLVAAALMWRSLLQAATLRGLARVLEGSRPGPSACFREAARRWREILVVGGTVSVLGLVSGFLYFIPVAILGGLVLLALPRVALDEATPAAALAGPGQRPGKALWVNLLYFVLAGALWGNLHLFAHLALGLGRSFFDLDVGYLGSVLSLDNPVYLLSLLVATLTALEPVRVLSAGLLHLEEKVRREGLDLAERIESLRRPRRRGAPRAAPLVIGALLLGTPAWGEASPSARQTSHDVSARTLAGRPGLRAKVVDLRRLLARVLARDEFHRLDRSAWDRPPTPGPEPEVDLTPLRLGGGNAGGGLSGFAILAVILAVAAIGVAGALAYLGLRGRRRPTTERAASTAPTPSGGVDALSRAPDDWRADADLLAARGEHREALRRAYLALLVGLHRKRAIEYEPARTNWEYLRRMRAPAGSRSLFGDLTRTFDLVWYGGRDVAAPGYADFVRGADRLVASVAPPTEAP